MEKIEFLSPSSEKIEGMCLELAKKIKASGFKFDLIVGVLRGGVIPAVYLSDFLGDHNIYAIRLRSYTGIGENEQLDVVQPLNIGLHGKKVLLVDDVADTGKSLNAALEHLKGKGAQEVKVACLHYKPWSKTKPDFFVEQTTAWIIYPWMVKETINELVASGKESELKRTGIPEDKIKKAGKL